MSQSNPIKDFHIVSISRADLDTLGYDTAEIDDEMMERIAHDLGEGCFEQMFSESLLKVTERLGIRKISDEKPSIPKSMP